MLHDIIGQHHLHRRKRIHQNHEPYPHPDKLKRVVDIIVYFASIIGPIMTLPQVWKIWLYQNATGVSVISWISYFFCAVIWLFYGILHKEKPIIVTNSIWLFLDLFIIIGTMLYG